MSTLADSCRLCIYYSPLQPNSADLQSTSADSCLLSPNSAEFRLTVPTQSLLMLYIGTVWCYTYSSVKRSVNAKRLPPLSGQTSPRCAQEKSRAHSISPSRDRSSAELRAEFQRNLGSTGKRRLADELPRFSQGSLARRKNEETNRRQRLGETGQSF